MSKDNPPPSSQGDGKTGDDLPLNINDLDQLSILDQTSDAIIITDLEGNIVFWNKQAERLIRLNKEEALGQSIFDVFIPRVDTRRGMEIVQSFNERGEWYGEMPIQSIDGQCHMVSVTSSLLKNKAGDPIGIIGLGRDITQRTMIERELEKKAEELKRSNEELQRFAYVASHDLQEPLRTVSSFVGLLEREATGNLNEKEMTYLRFIREGSKRMQYLIQDLLEYSRVETSAKDFAEVDMNEVVNKALLSLEYSIKESQAKVTVDELPIIFGDQTQMVQLFQNLMGNAIKFRRPGEPPRLEVSSVTNTKEHIFSVRDNGIGIAPEHANMLFKMFSRLHTNDEYPGTGIGLAIAKKIVERHGGRIWVESDGISGSNFSFTIPIASYMA